MATFYSDASLNGFQPKRKFRFTLHLKLLGEEYTLMATKVKKPSYDLGDKTHRFLNHEYKYPGIIKWQDVEASFIDAKDPNVGSGFYNLLINSGYSQPDTLGDALKGVTKVSSVQALGDVVIRQLDGGDVNFAGIEPDEPGGVKIDPTILDQWTLKNAFISKLAFGDLDYASDDLVEIACTFKYDYATYKANQGTYVIGT
tara:strand:- start:1684 stop:2283 length:600 start_codon:yes stop_codon:yes gene_type:complete